MVLIGSEAGLGRVLFVVWRRTAPTGGVQIWRPSPVQCDTGYVTSWMRHVSSPCLLCVKALSHALAMSSAAATVAGMEILKVTRQNELLRSRSCSALLRGL